MDLSRLTAIVFDVDGTLYHQGALQRTMALRLLREVLSRPISGMETVRVLRGYRRAQELLRGNEPEGALSSAHLRLASRRSGKTEQEVARVVARWMEREPLPHLEPLVAPALRRLLTTARSRGLRLGIFSDYPATAKIEAMRLTEFFEVTVAAQDAGVNRFKPHPAGLLRALTRLGAEPERALYVGDRHDVDAAAARAAGMPCIIVGRRRSSAVAGAISVADYETLHAMLFASDSQLKP